MIALCIKFKKQKRERERKFFLENLCIKLNIFNFFFKDTEYEVDNFFCICDRKINLFHSSIERTRY